MKKIIWFILAFIAASLIFFTVVYVVGLTAESWGMRLYDSEADQQRNFNIVMSLWLFLSVVAGVVAARKAVGKAARRYSSVD